MITDSVFGSLTFADLLAGAGDIFTLSVVSGTVALVLGIAIFKKLWGLLRGVSRR